MQAFGTQNFNDPKVEQQRQAELVKLGRVVETKRNELADLTQSRDETLDRLHQVKAQIDKQQSLNMLLQHTRDLKEQHTRAAVAQLEVARNNTLLSRARLAQVQVETERFQEAIAYHREMSDQLEARVKVENSTAEQYEALAAELRLQWLTQTKANEAMRRQIESHSKKLDIMREQHDEASAILENVKVSGGKSSANAPLYFN